MTVEIISFWWCFQWKPLGHVLVGPPNTTPPLDPHLMHYTHSLSDTSSFPCIWKCKVFGATLKFDPHILFNGIIQTILVVFSMKTSWVVFWKLWYQILKNWEKRNKHVHHSSRSRETVLFCCFTSQVDSYGHGGTVSSPNHTFSWASLNKQLTSTLCTYTDRL